MCGAVGIGTPMRYRKWVYVQKPQQYEIVCDKCGGNNIEWSEYERMIWCYDCKVDTEGRGGLFSGPISTLMVEMVGMSLARLYFKDKIIRYPVTRGHKIIYTKKRPEYMTEWTVKAKFVPKKKGKRK